MNHLYYDISFGVVSAFLTCLFCWGNKMNISIVWPIMPKVNGNRGSRELRSCCTGLVLFKASLLSWTPDKGILGHVCVTISSYLHISYCCAIAVGCYLRSVSLFHVMLASLFVPTWSWSPFGYIIHLYLIINVVLCPSFLVLQYYLISAILFWQLIDYPFAIVSLSWCTALLHVAVRPLPNR